MKKTAFVCFLSLSLIGCHGDYEHDQPPRSNVYYGQPAADLYENFGAPTRVLRLNTNERILEYRTQEIEKDWSYRYLYRCVMKFRLVDDRVETWTSDGESCVMHSQKSPTQQEGGLLDSLFGVSRKAPLTGEIAYDDFEAAFGKHYVAKRAADELRGKASVSQAGLRFLPKDAFDGKASTAYGVPQEDSFDDFAFPSRSSDLVPDDAFGSNAFGTESAKTFVRSNDKSVGVFETLPDDAFGDHSSTVYRRSANLAPADSPKKTVGYQLPADAFGDSSESFDRPVPVTLSHSTDADEGVSEEDDWSLFD